LRLRIIAPTRRPGLDPGSMDTARRDFAKSVFMDPDFRRDDECRSG